VDPAALLDEIKGLAAARIPVAGRLKVSSLAHVIMPYHRVLDKLRESKRRHRIGTTGRGIGPCYSDKVNRCGIRMIDLLNPGVFKEKLHDNLAEKNEIFTKVYRHPGFRFSQIYKEYLEFGRRLKPYICDTASYLNHAIEQKKISSSREPRGHSSILTSAHTLLLRHQTQHQVAAASGQVSHQPK